MTPHVAASVDDHPVDGELRMAGRMGALGGALGSVSGAVLWFVDPSGTGSPASAGAGIVLAAVIAIACLLLPWDRLSQPWVLFPIVSGILLTALACATSLGTESAYSAFYVFFAAMAGYFCTRAQALSVLALVFVAAALPILYDLDTPLIQRVEAWLLQALVSAVILVLLQHARARGRDATRRLRTLAMQDSLTGIANRRAFEQRAAAETARARRHSGELTVAFLDLDGFKAINDLYGHAAGDRMLRRVSHAIEGAVRGEDFVGRLGGDEFGVLLPGATETEAATVLARIDAAVRRVSTGDDGYASLSASAGSAAFPRDGAGLDELLIVADEALRAEKAAQAGRPHPMLEHLAPAEADEEESVDPADRASGTGDLVAGPLAAIGALIALVAAAWLGAGALGFTSVARPLILVAVVSADVTLSLVASRRATGAERTGWLLVALSGTVALVPFASALGAVLFGIGLVMVARVWPPDRAGVLDTLALLSLIAMCAVAFVALPALDAHTALGTTGAIGGAAITTFMLWCSAGVILRSRPAGRPDAWLGAGAFVVGAIGGVPLLLSPSYEPTAFPMGDLQVASVAAFALIAGAAWLRIRLGAVSAAGQPARSIGPNSSLAGAAAFTLAIVAVVAMYGRIPLAVVPFLLFTGIFRGLRVWVTERENERLVDVTRSSRRELADQYRATLIALGATLEARDGYTGQHGAETVRLVESVVRRLGLSGAQIDEVTTVARLHDLGKIGVPNEVLLKAGPLDDEEWEMMRRHPVIGERILRTVPGLASIARAVRHEHERWDGGGYPDGIAGEAIPLASRVVLVCDAFHAMTSDRPYRTALSLQDAVRELSANAGTQFDPAVVHALLEELEPGRATAPEVHQAAS
jgi:diguanylate cyclase (GGDEF)-like protein